MKSRVNSSISLTSIIGPDAGAWTIDAVTDVTMDTGEGWTLATDLGVLGSYHSLGEAWVLVLLDDRDAVTVRWVICTVAMIVLWPFGYGSIAAACRGYTPAQGVRQNKL
ncbi:hypothetical protein L1987_23218 [Smallanthus sonchifolius]|uniref:Uncharacterized protein n=1 Tax=Smallanthus sonchifolius TaxID=185202 RepID=A0ACB9IGU2_9ASTR|nr:hypothetical protein L1987_23218 [Smallanthus sonchifolius]